MHADWVAWARSEPVVLHLGLSVDGAPGREPPVKLELPSVPWREIPAAQDSRIRQWSATPTTGSPPS